MNTKMFLKAFAATLLMVSCGEKDDNNPVVPVGKAADVLIQTAIVNQDGQSGSGYIQLLEGIAPRTVDNKNAIPAGVSIPPFVYKNWIFTLPNFFGSDVSEIGKLVRENGQLKKVGALPVPGMSQATHLTFVNDTKAYVGLTGLGKIFIFNPTTMEKTGEIDLNTYGDPNPEPSGMIVRDNHLFVTLGQWKAGTWFPKEKVVEVLIIDIQTDEVIKHIKETKSEFSFPTNPGDKILMDADKNIYIHCIGAYGEVPGFDGGILRIKAGETDFDPDYIIKFNETVISGESGKISYLRPANFEFNGKTYGYAYIKEYSSNVVSPLNVAYIPLEIDLNAKTFKRIKELPVTNGYSTALGKYEDKVIFGCTGKTTKGFYVHDPKTGKTSSEPVIKVEGFPQMFYWFEK